MDGPAELGPDSFATNPSWSSLSRCGAIADRQKESDVMKFHCVEGLSVDAVDDGYLVLVPGRSDVLHLRGPQAEAFALARHGCDRVPPELVTPMAGLVELGVVTTVAWSRRRVLQLGGAAAAATVAAIALPSVAAAGSPTNTSVPTTKGTIDVDYLVVAGGGGGGAEGGGGAGGVLQGTAGAVGVGTFEVIVGDGGAVAQPGGNGGNGGSSAVGFAPSVQAYGGGGGGGGLAAGTAGGSGGGGAVGAAGGSGSPGQGNRGGTGNLSGGGGGGAGSVGSDGGSGQDDNGGAGGAGVAATLATAVDVGGQLVGTDRIVGGGGGGWGRGTGSAGGSGGGGAGGARTDSVAGGANTGGGGGGGRNGDDASSSGGSGLVILRYSTAAATGAGLTNITGGTTFTPGDGSTYHVFTTVGTTTFTVG